jgi:hypothetical protein
MSARTPPKRDAVQITPAYTREEFTAWLATSCERHGVGLTVTDPIIIAQVATLLGATRTPARDGTHPAVPPMAVQMRRTGCTPTVSTPHVPRSPAARTA